MLYTKTELHKSLFIQVATVKNDNKRNEEVWDAGTYKNRYPNEGLSSYDNHAHYYPEFSSIVAVSVGLFDDKMVKDVATITGEEEKILKDLSDFMGECLGYVPAGFNVSGYTMPTLMKRFLINRIGLPYMLDIRGKKPWEINTNDLMRDYQSSGFDTISLDAMALAFGLPSPTLKEASVNGSTEEVTNACEQTLRLQLDLAELLCKP